jgi:hypothetical protein
MVDKLDERNARISVNVGVTLPYSHKYSYIRPSVGMEIDVLEGEDPLVVMDDLTAVLLNKLDDVTLELDAYVEEVVG